MVGSGWVGGWVLVGGGLGYGSILEYYYKYTMTITHDALDLTIQIPWTCSNLCNLGLTLERHPSPIDYLLQPEIQAEVKAWDKTVVEAQDEA